METEIVEALLVVAHRLRTSLDAACAFDEYVAHEILLLRALARLGPERTGRDLARELGWSAGRVSQVLSGLVAKEHVARSRRISITEKGSGEARSGAYMLEMIGRDALDTIGVTERVALLEMLRKMWRVTRNASGS